MIWKQLQEQLNLMKKENSENTQKINKTAKH